MKYYEIEINIKPCTDATRAIMTALAADAGCEAFEDTKTGVMAYVQQALFDREALDDSISSFPISETTITYKVREAEDKDWNEQWEQEGFEPIVVADKLVIHDGRHLPSAISLQPSAISIEIDAHLAFGTGTHETTRMICATLLGMNLRGKRVLDCGCGTGILGICALKLGAASCVGYDIDEWSADNTRHNAVINQVDNRLQPLCGDSSLLSGYGAEFDLVMANINRNILLADMPRFVSVMAPHSTLILSGFYETDCALLESKAQQLGLKLTATKTDSDWACMVLNTP
ncbi:MAG: 50S ribosomal protein L11 methyltransferase [Prevotella sp.]|nr:50S ribosomal protein L11 methyltransferase [Prevotella sp.]